MRLIILAVYVTILCLLMSVFTYNQIDQLSTQIWEVQQQLSNQIADGCINE